MTSKWLSGRLEKTLRDNPGVKLTTFKNKIGRKWNIGVSRSMTFRARTMAYTNIDGSFKEQYKRIYDYANELLRSSFVSCRPIIGVDGCFLKGKYGGELLIAVGRDGND